MFCQDIGEMMSSRLDGSLGEEQQSVMDAHIDRCPSCRRRWELFQFIESRLLEAPEVTLSPHFTSSIMNRLDSPPTLAASARPTRSRAAGLVGLGGLLFIFAAITGGLSLWLDESSRAAFTHPALATKAQNLVMLFLSVCSAIGKALWSSLSLLDDRDVGLAVGIVSLVGLIVVLLWARLVAQYWQVDGSEGAV